MMVTNDTNPFDQLMPYLPPHLARYASPGIELVEMMTISDHLRSVRGVLSTYLPRYIVASIHKDHQPGRVSGGFHYGAVLFADVSGFTAMSEKLSVLGKEGAEEVTGIVNDYFTAMLEINDHHGGDLLKFGGDALLIFFEGHLGSHKALATGKAMMDAMDRFAQVQTSQGVFPLRMKIGMACGSVFLASLGTSQSMDHAVMGSTLYKMAQSEDNATAGEIVVHDEMREVTSDIASYSPVVQGFWKLDELHKTVELHDESRPDSGSISRDTGFDADILAQNLIQDAEVIGGLRPFVPEELFTRVITDPQRIAAYGSHRPVTITFTNFLGIDEIIETLGPDYEDSITAILNKHFIAMSEVITLFGGTVNRLDAYSKGHRILGLFGALQAHEDDPQRGVRAGLEMNKSLEGVNLETAEILNAIPELKEHFGASPLSQRIGINSGFVFGCNTGSKARREYTVMGDQVNLTARLMGIAQEGEVLIGQSTARLAEDTFNLEEKEAVKVKGKTDPVRNFAVREIKERSHWKTRLATSPIIGRDRELDLGREAIEGAIEGKAQVLVISGVSGLGKTRLAEELAWYGDQQGMDLLIGTCLSYGQTMTYHPWAEVLRELFGISATGTDHDTTARIEALQQGMEAIGEGPWAPVMGNVLGLEIPENDLTRDLDPKLRRQRALDLTVKLLKARAHTKPLMLVIEDAHWADPASMDLIDYVARNITGQPILFMLPHRPDIGLPDWTDYPHSIDMELADLPDDACKQIIHEMLSGLQLPKAMYEIILSRGCGNPFFIGEVVRALIDAGALERDADGDFHVVQDMSQVELPDTIHGVIISRIDRLIEADRRILQVASVIGRVFAYQTLDGVYSYDDLTAALRERLNYLNELSLTEIQVIETELYRFIHLTTREVVYEGLPFEHRRSLHRDIGSYIEEVFGENLSEQTSLLAYHYYEGQAWEKAMDYNLTAAQNAQREFANDTAILSGERALEAAGNLGPEVDTSKVRVKTHEMLGEVMTLVGQYDEALEQLALSREQVVSEDPTPACLSHLAELSRKTGEVYERRSEYETAFDWLHKGLRYLEDGEPSIEAARIYLLGTGVYRRQGDNNQALDWCQKSLSIASQIDTMDGQKAVAHAYYTLSGIHWRRGEFDQALEFSQKSLQIFEQINDIVGQSDAHNNLSIVYADLGDWDKAVDHLRKSMAVKEKIGDVFYQAALANNLAEIYRDQGKWQQAIELYEESNASWKMLGASLFDAVTLSNLGQVHVYLGDFAEAQDCLTEAEDLFAEAGSDDYLSELERRWGEYYLRTGDLEQALEHTERSIELADEQEARLDKGLSQRVLGEVDLERGNKPSARENLQESLSTLQELGSDYESAKTILVLARLALEEGGEFDRSQLEQAYLTFQALDAKVEIEQAEILLNQI